MNPAVSVDGRILSQAHAIRNSTRNILKMFGLFIQEIDGLDKKFLLPFKLSRL